ncbi:slipin family protein [Puteibacter caeruleilacunae]|nr:slipin family protein [Puteibacter caeruleilacunae]
MKRIRVKNGLVGLLFRSGNYKQVVTEGTYWLMPNEKVVLYNKALPFTPGIELNLLLKDSQLQEMLHIVEVKDNEIVLQYINNNFASVLSPGRYAFWKDLVNYTFKSVDLNQLEIDKEIDITILKSHHLLKYIRVYNIDSYETGLLFVDGKFEKQLEPGIYHLWNNTTPVCVYKADLRQQQIEVSGQEILTSDKATLRINFFAQYRIVDPTTAITQNKEYQKQLYILLQLAIREYIGALTMDALLEKKDTISEFVMDKIKDQVSKLGIELMNCGVKDIILPGDVKEIMNKVLVAQKQAQANIVTRREETASTRSLLNTAKLMEDNEMLFKLKEMEYVEKIADKINSISLSGGNQVVDQLKAIFTPNR